MLRTTQGRDQDVRYFTREDGDEIARHLASLNQILLNSLTRLNRSEGVALKNSLSQSVKTNAEGSSSFIIQILELKSIATALVAESEILQQRSTNHHRNIKELEDMNERLVGNLEGLEKEISEYKNKEKQYIGRIEKLELEIDNIEDLCAQTEKIATHLQGEEQIQLPREDVAQYLENQLNRQTVQSHIYRALLDRVISTLGPNVASAVDELQKNMMENEAIQEAEASENIYLEDWQSAVDRQTLKILSKSKQEHELAIEREELERKLDEEISAVRGAPGSGSLWVSKRGEAANTEALRLNRPLSSYQQRDQTGRASTSPSSSGQEIQDNIQTIASRSDFSALKNKLKEIKTKLL